MFSVLIPLAYLAVPIRCFVASGPSCRNLRKVLMSRGLGEIVCRQKKREIAATSSAARFCIERAFHAGRNIRMLEMTGDAIHPCWPEAQKAGGDKIWKWLAWLFGRGLEGAESKKMCLVRCYRTTSSRRNDTKQCLAFRYTVASCNPDCPSQGQFSSSFELVLYFLLFPLFHSFWLASTYYNLSLPFTI